MPGSIENVTTRYARLALKVLVRETRGQWCRVLGWFSLGCCVRVRCVKYLAKTEALSLVSVVGIRNDRLHLDRHDDTMTPQVVLLVRAPLTLGPASGKISGHDCAWQSAPRPAWVVECWQASIQVAYRSLPCSYVSGCEAHEQLRMQARLVQIVAVLGQIRRRMHA
jgi:hypothetical protein